MSAPTYKKRHNTKKNEFNMNQKSLGYIENQYCNKNLLFFFISRPISTFPVQTLLFIFGICEVFFIDTIYTFLYPP